MVKRTCLLIDDSKQDAVFPTIIEEGKKYNIEITPLQFNVGNPERQDLLTSEEVDIEKVLKVFQDEFMGVKIHLIAFDWNLSSKVVNGPLLIKALNEKSIRDKIPKILYSGILKEEIERLCDNYRRDVTMPFKDIWEQINTLISTGILTFVPRDDYEMGIVEQLRNIDDSVESSIESELRKFSDFKFNSSFPNAKFKDKSFGEIAEILDKDIKLRNEFTKEITEQVIAYLTEKL